MMRWEDIGTIRRPLLGFCGVLVLAVASATASSWIASEKDNTLASAARVRERSYARLHNVEIEKSEIAQYQPRFVELRAAGLIGGENRLAWIEALRQSQAARRIPSVSYEIDPQQEVTMDAPLDLADYRLRASRMQLHMGMMHELDLFNLLADLHSAGLFTVESCKMKRTGAPPDAGAAPRVTADCTLVWLSLATAPAIAGAP